MKFHVQIAVAIFAACLAGVAVAAEDPLEKVAAVRDIASSMAPPKDLDTRHDGAHFWNLKKGESEFDLIKVGSNRYRISRVTSGIDKEIEDPVFMRVNIDKPWLDAPPIKSTRMSNHQFLFALHEIEEPGKPETKSWHALIYIPVDKASGEDLFALIVRGIVNDAGKCDKLTGKEKAKCAALRKLAVMKMDNESLKDLREKIVAWIDEILPPEDFPIAPSKAMPDAKRYHNGIIHGALF